MGAGYYMPTPIDLHLSTVGSLRNSLCLRATAFAHHALHLLRAIMLFVSATADPAHFLEHLGKTLRATVKAFTLGIATVFLRLFSTHGNLLIFLCPLAIKGVGVNT